MLDSYEEFGAIKRATLKRETLADAEQSAYLKFVRPNRGGYPIPRHP